MIQRTIQRLPRLVCAWLLAALVLLPASGFEVRSIAIAGDGEFTRVTITSSENLEAGIFLGDGAGGKIIEVIPGRYAISDQTYYGEPTGGVAAYTLNADAIIFELDRPMMVLRELDLPPTGAEPNYRLVIDLAGVSQTRFVRAAASDSRRRSAWMTDRGAPIPEAIEASAQPATPASERVALPEPASIKPWALGEAIIAAASARRHKIAIDPGHGGRDPGAPIVSGGAEKSVVLQTSLKLKQLLEEDPRYDVLLTREADIYVDHEDRVSMAREWGADLFISVHADAALRPDVAGASVYTISTRGERRIAGTADKYGWHIPIEGAATDEVEGILTDLVKRETKSNSAIFAELLVPELEKAGPLLRNTHRQGNLFVLLAPDVPAVLVEIGFLSNRDDARRLKSRRGRQKSAEAIKRAIDGYFNRQDLLLASN